MLKSLELAFRGSSFQNFPGGEYSRTSLYRSHLPPNFEFVPKLLYYELPSKPGNTDSVSQNFKKLGKHIPGLPRFRVCPPQFLERIVALLDDILRKLSTAIKTAHKTPFYTTKFSLTNFMCQMFFDRVNAFVNGQKVFGR